MAVVLGGSTAAAQMTIAEPLDTTAAPSKFRSAEDGQFWRRFSLVGFAGGGAAWNDFERFQATQAIATGGFGFRYEVARKYGIQMGLDVAFGPDNAAVYVQVGSAWARP
jgi:hypothetical protein